MQSIIYKVAKKSSCGTCCSTLKKRPQMTYTFYINTGRFAGGSGEWRIDTKGYSGSGIKKTLINCYKVKGSGYLNPKATCQKNVGPLPATTYKIGYCKDTMHSI